MIAINAIINAKGKGNEIRPSMYKNLMKSVFSDVLRAKRIKKDAEERERRERAAEVIYESDILTHGHFCMIVWSRDCDMCESTNLSRYESVEQFYKSQENAGEWAEGPVTWTYISHEDAEDFQSSTRDLIMENRENGGDGFHLYR